MHWLVVDETNKNPIKGQFFILGGLVFTDEQIPLVNSAVEQIRLEAGYRDGDSFKFQISARPDHVDSAKATEAKKRLIAKLGELGVRMMTYVMLHDIGIRKTEQDRMAMGLNTLAWAYHRLLEFESAKGCMIIDRDDKQHKHLTHLFQNGIQIGDSRPRAVRDRIQFFGMTSNNASHLSSAVDVALGGFRFCVNAADLDDDAGGHLVANSIFAPLSELLWGVDQAGKKRIGGYGFLARPESVRVSKFAKRYSDLRARLIEYSSSVVDEASVSKEG